LSTCYRNPNLAEVIDSYPRVHRTATIILGAFTFRSWKSTDPVLTALDVLHQLYASEQRKLPAGVPTSFLTPAWRKLIGIGPTIDRRTWEVAVVVTLRDRLRAGDVWVEGSRAFRAFDDFLLPPTAFQAGELGLAVPDLLTLGATSVSRPSSGGSGKWRPLRNPRSAFLDAA